ncbi:hypothetical protein DL98DRAFT_529820 [Cadophora sp. DSE1049]|nr:hypothetical protein DL98DRAFT_529820 [Cadophora sp. DSE1049]
MVDQPSKAAKAARRSSLSSMPDVSSPAPESSTDTPSELVEEFSIQSTSQRILPSRPFNFAVPSTEASSHESIPSHPISTASSSKRVDLAAPRAMDEYVPANNTVNSEDGFTFPIQSELDTAMSLDLSSSIVPFNGMHSPAQSQTANFALAGFKPQNFTSHAHRTSTDSTAVDPVPAGSPTHHQLMSPLARNPAQAAAETHNRPLIPLPRKQEGYKMFTAGYNHRIFIEAAKIMADEALEEFFDFKAYAGESLEDGSTRNGVLPSDLREAAKDGTEPGVEGELMRYVEDNGGNVFAAHCGGAINSEPSAENTAMADDLEENQLSGVFSEVHSPTFGPIQSATEETKEAADTIDGGNEMEGLDEVDQL